jgi:hypothetical protein
MGVKVQLGRVLKGYDFSSRPLREPSVSRLIAFQGLASLATS